MKKTLALFLAVAMLLALAACGGGAATSSAAPAVESTSESAPAPAEEPADVPEPADEPAEEPAPVAGEVTLPLTTDDVTFRIWTQDFNDNCYAYFDDLNDTVWFQELEKRTGIHIEWTLESGTGGAEKLAIQVAAGDLPYDGIVSVGTVYSSGALGAYEDGVIVDLHNYDSVIPNYLAALNSEPDVYLKNCEDTEGHLFAFDKLWTLDTAPSVGLAIRQDWLEDCGLEKPVTIDEYHEVLTAFKNKEGTRSPLWINYRGNTVGGLFGNAYDVDTYYGPTQGYNMFYQIDGTVHWTPLEEGFREYLTTLNQWYEEGLIYPDFAAEVGDELIPGPDIFAKEQLGVAFVPLGLLPVVNEWSGEGANWGGAYAPRVTEDQTTHFLVGVQYVISGHGLYMTTSCEEPELFARWADYLYTEEGQLFKNYGVEGESLSYENGEPVLSYDAIFANAEFDNNTNVTYAYYLGNNDLWTINDAKPRNISYNDVQLDAINCWLDQNDIAYNMPYGVTLSTEETSRFAALFGDISTYVEEFWPAAIMGARDISEFDDFVQKLYDMGAQECVDIYQAALDRYNGV